MMKNMKKAISMVQTLGKLEVYEFSLDRPIVTALEHLYQDLKNKQVLC